MQNMFRHFLNISIDVCMLKCCIHHATLRAIFSSLIFFWLANYITLLLNITLKTCILQNVAKWMSLIYYHLLWRRTAQNDLENIKRLIKQNTATCTGQRFHSVSFTVRGVSFDSFELNYHLCFFIGKSYTGGDRSKKSLDKMLFSWDINSILRQIVFLNCSCLN